MQSVEVLRLLNIQNIGNIKTTDQCNHIAPNTDRKSNLDACAILIPKTFNINACFKVQYNFISITSILIDTWHDDINISPKLSYLISSELSGSSKVMPEDMGESTKTAFRHCRWTGQYPVTC